MRRWATTVPSTSTRWARSFGGQPPQKRQPGAVDSGCRDWEGMGIATENVLTLLSVLGKMMLLIAVGFGAAWIGILREQGRKCVTDLVIDLIYPCYILNSYLKNIGLFQGGTMFLTLGVSGAFSLLLLLASRFLFPRVPPNRRCVLQYASVVSNSAFLGLPMAENIFGSQGLLCASIFSIPLRINTFGIAIHYYTAQTEADGTLRALVTQPSILATVAGILAVLIGRHPPASCEAALASIGACSTPLSMMVIGAVIYANRKELRLRLLTMQFCLLRLILIPAVVYLTLRWLEIDRVLLGTAVLMAAMPAGTTGALLAEKYGADTSYAGEVLLISTLASIVTLPIWCCLCIFI